jgi:hypothetical protein
MATSIAATVAWYKSFYAGSDTTAMRRLTITQIAALSQAPEPVAA